MSESHVLSGLKAKQDDIERRIADLENEIEACRVDDTTISEALRIFGEPISYVKAKKTFSRGELARVIFDALRTSPGGLDTKELAAVAMRAKGLDLEDSTLVSTTHYRVGIAMQRYQGKRRVLLGEFQDCVRKCGRPCRPAGDLDKTRKVAGNPRCITGYL